MVCSVAVPQQLLFLICAGDHYQLFIFRFSRVGVVEKLVIYKIVNLHLTDFE